MEIWLICTDISLKLVFVAAWLSHLVGFAVPDSERK